MLKTTAKAVRQALLGWTVPISTGRRGKMTHRHSLQPLFFGLAKQKKTSFPQHEIIKKNTMELPQKRTKRKDWSVPKPHVWCTLYQRRYSQNINASTRGFRSGGLFMASPLPHFGRIIHSSTRDFGRDFWCPRKLFRHRPSSRILELTDIRVACFQDMLMWVKQCHLHHPWQGMVTIPPIYIYLWVFIPLKLVILWLKQ